LTFGREVGKRRGERGGAHRIKRAREREGDKSGKDKAKAGTRSDRDTAMRVVAHRQGGNFHRSVN